MKQRVKLTFTDRDPHDGTLASFMSPPDQVAFERTYNIGIGKFSEEQRAEWILWFLWRAWKREAQMSGPSLDFDAFLEVLDGYEMPYAEVDADPPVAAEARQAQPA